MTEGVYPIHQQALLLALGSKNLPQYTTKHFKGLRKKSEDRFEQHCSGQWCWKPLAWFEPPPKQPEHKVSSPVVFLQCLLLKFLLHFHTCYGVPDAVPVFPAAHTQGPGEMRRADPLEPMQHFAIVPSPLPSKGRTTCWCAPSAPRLSARTSTKLTQTPSQKSCRFTDSWASQGLK